MVSIANTAFPSDFDDELTIIVENLDDLTNILAIEASGRPDETIRHGYGATFVSKNSTMDENARINSVKDFVNNRLRSPLSFNVLEVDRNTSEFQDLDPTLYEGAPKPDGEIVKVTVPKFNSTTNTSLNDTLQASTIKSFKWKGNQWQTK